MHVYVNQWERRTNEQINGSSALEAYKKFGDNEKFFKVGLGIGSTCLWIH